ncbi:sensor histidine kinase [Cytobacillus suaedae]|nr:sensor histidine kinase [Cytobacillus suaedae]
MKLHSAKLSLLQGLVIVGSLICIWMFLSNTPIYYDKLLSHCIFEECEFAPMPATTEAALSNASISPEMYALLFVTVDTLLVFYFYIAAAIVIWKCFFEPMGLLAGFMLVTFGTVFPSTLTVTGVTELFFTLGWCTFLLFFMLFPKGRFLSKWIAGFTIIHISILTIGEIFPESSFNLLHMPLVVKSLFLLSALVAMGGSQLYRYKKQSTPTERQQTKWVVYGLSLMLLSFISINLLYIPGVVEGPLSYLFLNVVISISVAIIPTTLTFAIVKHRLWDIDPIVNRTIVYGVLSVCVILIYVLSVSYLSRLFKTEENVIISLVSTGLVAVLFAPLKVKLQKLINRLMYGKKDEPFTVLTTLSQQWEQPMTIEDTIKVVVNTIRDSLKLPYTAISFTIDSRETVVAASGEPSKEVISIPIIHRGENLGNLLLSPRTEGEELLKDERQLLDVLIRQAGPVIQGVKMSVGMKLLAEEVQESREKLVLAREEERRKLRRNLHDDLAPRLAALALNVATAERMVTKDLTATTNLLSELKRTIRSTVDDIRTLVHDLRPPTLDELGLVGAIKQRIQELSKVDPSISETVESLSLKIDLDVTGEIPILPAAVEVAAYRIITESLVNVIRHSSAKNCRVHLKNEENMFISIEIIDDGIGLRSAKAASPNGGIGMQSIREQAAELGGKCMFETRDEGGTRVRAFLPYETERKPHENFAS